MSEFDDDSITNIANPDAIDEETLESREQPELNVLGIVEMDAEFDYILADGELRIYAEDETDEQWIQSPDAIEVNV